ncbi:flavodoxin [Streptomyces sp. NPDC058321]|uniref:flavodoxin n=1 Tax=Streptomyces sp. NPDC058321 TaxID=3346445 RepID=UPI0036EEFF18
MAQRVARPAGRRAALTASATVRVSACSSSAPPGLLPGRDRHAVRKVSVCREQCVARLLLSAWRRPLDARPRIADPLRSIDRYDTILLGSPIWNVRAPLITPTFTEELDFRGKTVVPFTTCAMSGLGTVGDYTASCP